MNSSSPDTGSSSLVERLVRQDRNAWDEAFARHAPAILSQVRGSIRSRNWYPLQGQEQDILVATFVRAFQHIGNFRGTEEQSFLAYLRKVALSVCITELRKHRLREVPLEEVAIVADPPGDQSEALLLRQAIAELSPDLRQVIALRLRGFTWKETVEELHIPDKEFWRRMNAAFRILRKRLDASDDAAHQETMPAERLLGEEANEA